MGTFTYMKGTLIAHNGANTMGANGNLEGRMLSTNGAIGFSTGVVYTSYSLCSDPLAATGVATNVYINGGSNGTATVSITGGTGPFTVNWNNGMTGAAITGLVAGTYTATVTDAQGAVVIVTVIVSQPPPLVATGGATNVTVFGGSNGTATVSITGGTPPYAVTWNNGMTGVSITGLIAGTYTATVTDAHGSVVTVTVIVTQPNALHAAVTGGNNVSCNGGNNGSIVLTITGGVPAYTVNWSNGLTGASLSGLAAGTYSATVTDANGGTYTVSNTVSQPAIVVASTYASNAPCHGANGSAGVSASGGTAPYTYLWSNNATTANLSGLAAGSYSVTVTDANGCSANDSITVSQLSSVAVSINNISQPTCNNGGLDGSLCANATGGTGSFTYSWSPAGSTQCIAGLGDGTYSVTVTDANGCSATSAPVSIARPVCCQVTNPGSIGNDEAHCGPYIPSTIVSIANPSGGLGTVQYVWLWNTVNVVNNGNSGWVVIPGANGPSYTPTGTITQSTYYLRCSRSTGCSSFTGESNIVSKIVNPIPAVSVSATNVSCNGGANGTATSTVTSGTAPYTYLWSNNATTANLSGLAAGSYSVTVTDANGCSANGSTTISQLSSVAVSINNISQPTCNNGGLDGSLCANATGGTGAFTYSWSPAGSTQCMSGLGDGTYSVIVTDANGCSASSAPVSIARPVCCQVTNPGSIGNDEAHCGPYTPSTINSIANPSGGLGAVQYVWLYNYVNVPNNGSSGWVMIPGANSASYSPGAITQSTYFLRCSRSTGCTSYTGESNIVSKIVNPVPAISATSTSVSCNGGANGTVTSTVTSGTAPYTYLWSNNATTANLSGLAAGSYSVTVTDANGCSANGSTTISQLSSVTVSINNISQPTCNNGGLDGSLCANANGGSGAYTYAWSNGASTQCISGLGDGTYSVTVTDANGCSATSTPVSIACPVCCQVTNPGSIGNDEAHCGPYIPSTIVSIANPSGGLGTVQYVWLWNTVNVVNNGNSGWVVIPGANGPSYTPTGTITQSTYYLRCSRSTGCSSFTGESNIVSKIVNPIPAVSVSATNVSCNGGASGTALATVTSGTAPFTYLWNNGATSSSISGLIVSSYSVSLTDVNGCTANGSVTISEPTVLTTTSTSSNATINGVANGTASVTPAGGTAPYSVTWSNGMTGASISGLAAGNYTATITDANGCATTTTVIIGQPDAITATPTVTNVSCNGGSNGAISLAINGGVQPYSVLWNNGMAGASISGLTAGTYTATVTDANGGTYTVSSTITQPNVLNATATVVNCLVLI